MRAVEAALPRRHDHTRPAALWFTTATLPSHDARSAEALPSAQEDHRLCRCHRLRLLRHSLELRGVAIDHACSAGRHGQQSRDVARDITPGTRKASTSPLPQPDARRASVRTLTMQFTHFHPLESIAHVNVAGVFDPGWSGRYVRIWQPGSSYRQPEGNGSGLIIPGLRLLPEHALPADLRPLTKARGFVYVLVSCTYPILYVGITLGTLGSGMFGAGRFPHHVRKLLASRGCSTNHAKGWHEHARQLHAHIKAQVEARHVDPADMLALAPRLWGDWRIAVAHHPDPEPHEGTVLHRFEALVHQRHGQCMILNTRKVRCEPVDIHVPGNWDSMCGGQDLGVPATAQHAPVPAPPAPAPTPEELEPIEHDLSVADDYASDIAEMPAGCREKFMRLLTWARDLALTRGVEEKLVRRYTKQPRGCNGIPMVVFAPLGSSGRALDNRWLCRIPLKCPDDGMTIVLPTRLRGPVADNDLTFGKDTNFRPNDMDDFLRRPEHYVTPAG